MTKIMIDEATVKLALEALEPLVKRAAPWGELDWLNGCKAITALREALASEAKEQPRAVGTLAQQEPVTLLPDGSAFAVMSYPLPKDHWLYADRQYNDGEYEPVELGKPVLTHELRDAVVSAVRYAIRGATNCGKEVDFDPDALVQNAVYALCGPFTSPPASKQRVDWIDPNDKTQKQYLPHIGEPVLFCHGGKTYCGHHNGGSFQNQDEYFNTWECRWMHLPAAHGIKENT